jgi:hypothetical protein
MLQDRLVEELRLSGISGMEGDLLIFRRELGDANVTTLVERESRCTVMIKNRHARPIMDKFVDAFSPLPSHANSNALMSCAAAETGSTRSRASTPSPAFARRSSPGPGCFSCRRTAGLRPHRDGFLKAQGPLRKDAARTTTDWVGRTARLQAFTSKECIHCFEAAASE